MLWGDKFKDNVEDIFKCVIKLDVYTKTWLSNKPHFENNPREGEKYKSAVEATVDGDDELSLSIVTAIKNIEKKLRPYLSDY